MARSCLTLTALLDFLSVSPGVSCCLAEKRAGDASQWIVPGCGKAGRDDSFCAKDTEITTACHMRDGGWAGIRKHPHPGRVFKHVLNLRTYLIRAFGHKRVMIILVLPRKSK